MGLGLTLYTAAIIVAVSLLGIVGFLVAIRQEEAEQRGLRLVSAEVGHMELAEIRRLVRQGLLTPHQQFWLVLEEGLVAFRPRDRPEELQRQRLLQEVRLRLIH